MDKTLRRAAAHKGAAFVEILQNCNVFNDMAWESLYDKDQKLKYELKIEHGKALTFGSPDDQSGLVLDGLTPRVVKVKDTAPDKLWVHDENNRNAAAILGQLFAPDFPIPLGVISNQTGIPTYEERSGAQEEAALAKGPGSMDKLLRGGETWTVG
jgi:2-oxoglutarate ferredoxin oxidoreductase subunit beta